MVKEVKKRKKLHQSTTFNSSWLSSLSSTKSNEFTQLWLTVSNQLAISSNLSRKATTMCYEFSIKEESICGCGTKKIEVK